MAHSACLDSRPAAPARGRVPSRLRPAAWWPLAVLAAVLTAIGVSVARSFDSGLLGFMAADLLFLIGVSLKSAVESGGR